MALRSLEVAPAPKEIIPQRILAAAKLVPVGDYLKIRSQIYAVDNRSSEWGQIVLGGILIREHAKKSGEKFGLTDKVECSVDPWVIGARRFLKNVPLAEYLAARHEYLETAVDNTTRQRDWYKAAGIHVDEREKAEDRLTYLSGQLDLTEMVADAAGISLSVDK